MSRTARDLTPSDLERFSQYAREMRTIQERALSSRREQAWALAHEVAKILRGQFGATRVLVFGSLLDAQRFSESSDVDIAAYDIPPHKVFEAMGEVWTVGVSKGIAVNLFDVAMCHAELVDSIMREGISI